MREAWPAGVWEGRGRGRPILAWRAVRPWWWWLPRREMASGGILARVTEVSAVAAVVVPCLVPAPWLGGRAGSRGCQRWTRQMSRQLKKINRKFINFDLYNELNK